MTKYEHIKVLKTDKTVDNIQYLMGYFGVGTMSKAIVKGLDLAVRVLGK